MPQATSMQPIPDETVVREETNEESEENVIQEPAQKHK